MLLTKRFLKDNDLHRKSNQQIQIQTTWVEMDFVLFCMWRIFKCFESIIVMSRLICLFTLVVRGVEVYAVCTECDLVEWGRRSVALDSR